MITIYGDDVGCVPLYRAAIVEEFPGLPHFDMPEEEQGIIKVGVGAEYVAFVHYVVPPFVITLFEVQEESPALLSKYRINNKRRSLIWGSRDLWS